MKYIFRVFPYKSRCIHERIFQMSVLIPQMKGWAGHILTGFPSFAPPGTEWKTHFLVSSSVSSSSQSKHRSLTGLWEYCSSVRDIICHAGEHFDVVRKGEKKKQDCVQTDWPHSLARKPLHCAWWVKGTVPMVCVCPITSRLFLPRSWWNALL